ncbi:hypothetical protein [uncultured Propionivibrio sp.]|uniref:hypothetical protein n=1 Tax=uncultured Propionivibrio sp. TaxID=426737 RepID=UPI0029C0F8D6|nr:hypothetical protein [uncultured Propionivibrio sp.]
MKKHHSDLPTLINCLTGNPATADEMRNPRVMAGVFEQMAHEVWRFAPLDPNHQYQKYLPFDYVWHRLSVGLSAGLCSQYLQNCRKRKMRRGAACLALS